MSTSTHAVEYGSFAREETHVTGRRIIATLIDGLILGAAYNFLVLLFGEMSHPRPWEWNGVLENVAVNLFYCIGVVAYYVLMEGYLGQTLGKMVTGIMVIGEDRTSPPGVGAAFVRTVLRIVDGILGYLVAFISVLMSEKRQRLGDMAARTLVVRR